MSQKLGARQRRMLKDMAEFGDGRYPSNWRMGSGHRSIMEALYCRGMVTSAGRYAVLTPAGEAAVNQMAAR